MENLCLQSISQEYRSRTWQCNASPQAEEKPRKQVQFEVDEELDDQPSLPTDLVHFLVEGAAPEQSSTPSLPAQLPAPTKSPQHSHAWTVGAWPKVLGLLSHG